MNSCEKPIFMSHNFNENVNKWYCNRIKHVVYSNRNKPPCATGMVYPQRSHSLNANQQTTSNRSFRIKT